MPKRPSASSTSVPTKVGAVPPYTLEFFVDDDGKELVRNWLRSLSLRKKQVLGAAMNKILQHLGIGVCATEYGKQLGHGLFEFRVRQNADSIQPGLPPEQILIRVFCHAHGDRLVLLLGGYDKGEDPSRKRQQAEIEEARKRLATWKRRRASPP